MPFVAGTLSLTRCSLPGPLERAPAFEREPFLAITPGSQVRESIGFVPFEPEGPWEVGPRRYAFRVRLDRLRADPAAVRERFTELLRGERAEPGGAVGPARRRELRALAEEELLAEARPRMRLIEGVIEQERLYLGTTADAELGRVLELLRRVGVHAELRTPWGDHGESEADHELVRFADPVRSAHGCALLKSLLEDHELIFEPATGYVRVQARGAKVTITGAVMTELHHLVKKGGEILAAQLLAAEATFRLDGPSFRVSGLRLPASEQEHWVLQIDERLERIESLFALLDRKYAQAKGPAFVARLERRRGSPGRSPGRRGAPEAPGGRVVPFAPR